MILVAGCGPAKSDAVVSPPAHVSQECPALPPPISPDVLTDRDFEKGPFAAHLNARWETERELIEVRWLPVMEVGGLHEMLVYTDDQGDQFMIDGFPHEDFDLQLELGSLVMQVGPLNPTSAFTEDLSSDSKRKVIAAGEDLSAAWDKMRRVAAIIDKLGINYDLAGPNSNSATETILKYTGAPSPQADFAGDVGAAYDVLKAASGAPCEDRNDAVRQVLK